MPHEHESGHECEHDHGCQREHGRKSKHAREHEHECERKCEHERNKNVTGDLNLKMYTNMNSEHVHVMIKDTNRIWALTLDNEH
jgi:hypothetical protein